MQKRLGGSIGSEGDASEAVAWLCLIGSDAVGPWILWLESFEIDGPTIGGFQWRRLASNEKPDRRCSALRKGDDKVKLPLALHLGMTETELRATLGRPTMTRGKTLIFCHDHQETINKEIFDSSNTLAVVLRGGAVWEIVVIKSTVS